MTVPVVAGKRAASRASENGISDFYRTTEKFSKNNKTNWFSRAGLYEWPQRPEDSVLCLKIAAVLLRQAIRGSADK